MAVFPGKYFNRIYFIVCSAVFVVVCLRALFIPFSHDEASTFFFYIQSNNYLPYKAHVYTNNHVLNSALANICYHVAGSHRFVLRLPNVLSFLLLCVGVSRYFRYLRSASSKIILTCFFILTFNLLDFFELCRGYGLSIAFMVYSLSHLLDYFSRREQRSLLLFLVFWQLALAANLTLVVLTLFLLLLILLFQYKKKLLFTTRNIALQFINLAILVFWVKFSFFYRSKGVLDSGVGEEYWEISFKSLMLFVFGTDALWIQALTILLFTGTFIFSLARFFKTPAGMLKIFEPQIFFLFVLTALITLFYLQKKILNVNYPEDRTGLFFYIFFAFALVFFFDSVSKWLSAPFAAVLLTVQILYFCLAFDLESFTHYFYHVVPKEFYVCLENEYKERGRLFTVGGHPNREMNYAFLNYRGGGLLNPMDEVGQMRMNCDYYIAMMSEKPFYRFFYDEIAYDRRWHRVLLKRKQEIRRIDIPEISRQNKNYIGGEEYLEFLRFYDSAGITKNCLEAELELTFKKAPKPFKAFIVLEIKDENGNLMHYRRLLLNWIADDLTGQTKRFKLTSGPLAGKYKNIVVYLWNIDRTECEVELKELRVFNLSAPGINVVIPKNYYPYVKRIVKENQL